jgi:CDP-glycerol glycerophosphotransferase
MNQKIKSMLRAARLKKHTGDPDPDAWLFSSTDNSHFNYNSRYLFLYCMEHHPELRIYFVINDENLRVKLQKEYGADYFIETLSEEGIKKALSCGVWFTSAGLPVYGFGLNKKRRIINLWHGIPLKKIALMDPNESALQRLYFKKMFSENYTDLVTTSEEMSEIMQESFAVPAEKMRIWGQPRCDLLFKNFDRNEYFRIIYAGNMVPVKKMVLYAPTFRTGKDVQLFPFADFDREKLDVFLEKNQIMLCIRTHIRENTENLPAESAYVRYLNEDKAEDVMDVLSAFDLLITDYSSIYIDYMLLNRPMLFLPYDLEEYRKGHGFNLPYEEVTPGRKPADFKSFLKGLYTELEEDTMRIEREEVCRRFHQNAYPCCEAICQNVREELKK